MKPKYENIILRAMPLIISDLKVNSSFLAHFESHDIFDSDDLQKVEVSLMVQDNLGHTFDVY